MTPVGGGEQGLLDALPDGVVVADERGTVVAMNDAAAGLLGSPDSIGKHLADVICLQDHAGNDWFGCTEPYAGLATRTGLTEASWFLPDGTELLLTARIERPSPRDPVRNVAVSLRSARARARLDRERSDLVATVAHELRSPLTGVKGFVATLLSKWDRLSDDQKQLMLQTVNVDADRLTRLIAELLDVARIDTGRLSLYPRPVDFEKAVHRVLESVRAGTGREIALQVEGALPMAHADPDKLAQVVHNLVDNAIRHGDGDVRLTLSTMAGDDEPRGASSCWSTTRATGSVRPSAAGCSPSSGSTAPAAVRGWACTSSTAWSAPTAAWSRSTTHPAAARDVITWPASA